MFEVKKNYSHALDDGRLILKLRACNPARSLPYIGSMGCGRSIALEAIAYLLGPVQAVMIAF